MTSLHKQIDDMRRAHGFLTPEEVFALVETENCIWDPFSVLISRHCDIGRGNWFYPGTRLEVGKDGALSIGDQNIFHGNTIIVAETGEITIGCRNQFGEGGVIIKANQNGANIMIGDDGRYLGGAAVFGGTCLGSGSQLLGPVTVHNCTLKAGAAYSEKYPDRRAGLVKGHGIVRDLHVPVGHVVDLNGAFRPGDLKLQSEFHKKV